MTTEQTGHICQTLVSRFAEQGYKPGKKRDKAAVEFICGAAAAAMALRDPVANSLTMLAMLTATRGYSALSEHAARNTTLYGS